MSHELRTPLNAVIGFSEVLLERMFGELNDRQDEYLRDILGSGRHLLQLLNDILDLSKVEAGRMGLEPSTFSLRSALEYGVSMVRERAARHGIHLSINVDDDVDTVESDELRVKQVLVNLLSNAVKFTPDGGDVSMNAREREHQTAVWVSDTGIGIAPADQERIFESFQQGQRGTQSEEGTGLALEPHRSAQEGHDASAAPSASPFRGESRSRQVQPAMTPDVLRSSSSRTTARRSIWRPHISTVWASTWWSPGTATRGSRMSSSTAAGT